MTSKEALEKLIKFCETQLYYEELREVSPYINCIKQDLDRLEVLEKENKRLENRLKKKKGKLRHYSKIKKVIEIIKNKKVNIYHIWVFDDYNQYVEHYPFAEYHAEEDMLNIEEFNFIKEVLEK